MKKHIALAFAGLILMSGCFHKSLTSLNDVGPDEAAVVGRFRVVYNNEDVTDEAIVTFVGASTWQVTLDATGFVFAKLPLGEYAIRAVNSPGGMGNAYGFDSGDAMFTLTQSRSVNYIGDIEFNWHAAGVGTRLAATVGGALAGGLVGAVVVDQFLHGGLVLSVKNDLPEAQAAFRAKFPSQVEIHPHCWW